MCDDCTKPHDVVDRLVAISENFRQSNKPPMISAYSTMQDAAGEIRLLREILRTTPCIHNIDSAFAESAGFRELAAYANNLKTWIPKAIAALRPK